MKTDLAPLRGMNVNDRPWEGNCPKKPWDYKVTAVVPVLDTFDQLDVCIKLLSLQTERPYIIVIDTGSGPKEYARIESLRSDTVEVHSIRLNGVLHPSDFPAMAMDMGFSLCRTEYLFATHADCFVRRRDFIETLLNLCPDTSPVVGYEISPRSHSDWHGMVSHTATMYHMPTMDKIGFGWSQRRLSNMYDIADYRPNPMRPNWPDTELLGNYILRKNKIKPHLLGSEPNFSRHKDDNIDHFRSFTSGKLYCPVYYATATGWYREAKADALARIAAWENELNERENIGRSDTYLPDSLHSPHGAKHKELDGDGVFEQQKLREDHIEVPRGEAGACEV